MDDLQAYHDKQRELAEQLARLNAEHYLLSDRLLELRAVQLGERSRDPAIRGNYLREIASLERQLENLKARMGLLERLREGA